jgi:hypothetical protein
MITCILVSVNAVDHFIDMNFLNISRFFLPKWIGGSDHVTNLSDYFSKIHVCLYKFNFHVCILFGMYIILSY